MRRRTDLRLDLTGLKKHERPAEVQPEDMVNTHPKYKSEADYKRDMHLTLSMQLQTQYNFANIPIDDSAPRNVVEGLGIITNSDQLHDAIRKVQAHMKDEPLDELMSEAQQEGQSSDFATTEAGTAAVGSEAQNNKDGGNSNGGDDTNAFEQSFITSNAPNLNQMREVDNRNSTNHVSGAGGGADGADGGFTNNLQGSFPFGSSVTGPFHAPAGGLSQMNYNGIGNNNQQVSRAYIDLTNNNFTNDIQRRHVSRVSWPLIPPPGSMVYIPNADGSYNIPQNSAQRHSMYNMGDYNQQAFVPSNSIAEYTKSQVASVTIPMPISQTQQADQSFMMPADGMDPLQMSMLMSQARLNSISCLPLANPSERGFAEANGSVHMNELGDMNGFGDTIGTNEFQNAKETPQGNASLRMNGQFQPPNAFSSPISTTGSFANPIDLSTNKPNYINPAIIDMTINPTAIDLTDDSNSLFTNPFEPTNTNSNTMSSNSRTMSIPQPPPMFPDLHQETQQQTLYPQLTESDMVFLSLASNGTLAGNGPFPSNENGQM